MKLPKIILRLLTRPKPAPYSAETLASLRALIKSPDWPIYKLLLDIKITEAVQSLLATTEDSQCHYLRGYMQGLLHSAIIPEQVVQDADTKEARNARAAADAERRRDAAKSALLNTSLYG